MYLCQKSLISLRESLRLFPIAPCFSLKAPIFMPDSISMTGLKVLMILSSKPPCLFLTAHSGKVSILRSRNQPKIAVNQWFSPLIAVVWPSEIPSVLSGINRIQRWSQSKPPYLAFLYFFASIYSIQSRGQGCHQE